MTKHVVSNKLGIRTGTNNRVLEVPSATSRLQQSSLLTDFQRVCISASVMHCNWQLCSSLSSITQLRKTYIAPSLLFDEVSLPARLQSSGSSMPKSKRVLKAQYDLRDAPRGNSRISLDGITDKKRLVCIHYIISCE